MRRIAIGLILASGLFGPSAWAQCAVPNTLTNGTNADATQVMANFSAILTCINSLPPPTSAATVSAPRQTVSAGPVTSAGLPDFLPGSSGSLSIASQNVSSAATLAVTAANNVDSTTGAQKDQIGFATSNLTWSGLTASTTNYLYVTVASNGALTAGKTTLAPIYQWGGTPGTANGQFTFNIGEMRGYLGNGSTAPQAYVVFLGEAVTSGSAVTSTVAYAYNGRYDSGYTATLPSGGSSTSKNHNLGVVPRSVDVRFQCTTTDAGWAVGDEVSIDATSANNGANETTTAVGAGRLSMTMATSGNPYYLLNRSTGFNTAMTLASWKYRFVAERGW